MLQFVVACNVISVGGPPYHITTAKWMQGLTVALRAVCLTGEGLPTILHLIIVISNEDQNYVTQYWLGCNRI